MWSHLLGFSSFSRLDNILLNIYEVCQEGIQPCNMQNRDIYWRKYKIYIGQWCLRPLQSRHLGTSHKFFQSPSAAPSYFLESHLHFEISSLSKVILVLGRARSWGCQIWTVGGLSHLDDWIFRKKTAQDVIYEQAHCCDEAANHHVPIAVAFWLIPIFPRRNVQAEC